MCYYFDHQTRKRSLKAYSGNKLYFLRRKTKKSSGRETVPRATTRQHTLEITSQILIIQLAFLNLFRQLFLSLSLAPSAAASSFLCALSGYRIACTVFRRKKEKKKLEPCVKFRRKFSTVPWHSDYADPNKTQSSFRKYH